MSEGKSKKEYLFYFKATQFLYAYLENFFAFLSDN